MKTETCHLSANILQRPSIILLSTDQTFEHPSCTKPVVILPSFQPPLPAQLPPSHRTRPALRSSPVICSPLKIKPFLTSALWLTVSLLLWLPPHPAAGPARRPLILHSRSHEISSVKPNPTPSCFFPLTSRSCHTAYAGRIMAHAHAVTAHARISLILQAAVLRTASGRVAKRVLSKYPLRE